MSKKTFNDIHEINERSVDLKAQMGEAIMDARSNLLEKKTDAMLTLTPKMKEVSFPPIEAVVSKVKLSKDTLGTFLEAMKNILLHEKKVSDFCIEKFEDIGEQCEDNGGLFPFSKNSLRSPRRTIYAR